MMVVGLTGGFASGKTTVARMFKDLGAQFLSADDMVHSLLKNPGPCQRRVVRVFGKGVLFAGRIDRRKLGRVIFKNPLSRKTLERIIHPAVIGEIKKQVQAFRKTKKKKVFIIEVPLLFEAGLEKTFDTTLVVVSSRSQQIQRALQTRFLTRQEIQNRIQAQLPFAIKRRMADILIDNRGSLSYTKRQVAAVWRTFQRKKESH